MRPAEYRAKAVLLLEQAQAYSENRTEIMQLALSYLRLADMAEKNAGNDVVYETPSVSMPMQQQPQPQQQQQAAVTSDKLDD
jgi:uncharacterized protein YfaP (DUF2135 family)